MNARSWIGIGLATVPAGVPLVAEPTAGQVAPQCGDTAKSGNAVSLAWESTAPGNQDAKAPDITAIRKAAEGGHAETQFVLGWKLCFMEGVFQDTQQGMDWIRKPAERRVVPAETAPAWNHAGHGGGECAKWRHKATERGDADSMCVLGERYRDGRFLPKDDAESVKWHRKGADAGDDRALFALAGMYAAWRCGLPTGDAEAVNYCRKAAERGSWDATYEFGMRRDQGNGVPKDPVRAYIWLSHLAAQKNESAKKQVARLASEMTPQQTAQGETLLEKPTSKQQRP